MHLELLEIEKMKKSYGYLFEIENTLRNSTSSLLRNKYGELWRTIICKKYKNKLTQKHLEEMYYHELISFISMIPDASALYSEEVIKGLKSINMIRNKIAHCEAIEGQGDRFLVPLKKDMGQTHHCHLYDPCRTRK
ncbi:hypothetical protein [Pseudalkalibacillus hwajinpoensis]|uniref:hypothetical protein n=1 Tax=Guptibacillus hwajinpoensis TaxID=208199 RepID=UPI0038501AD1